LLRDTMWADAGGPPNPALLVDEVLQRGSYDAAALPEALIT